MFRRSVSHAVSRTAAAAAHAAGSSARQVNALALVASRAVGAHAAGPVAAAPSWTSTDARPQARHFAVGNAKSKSKASSGAKKSSAKGAAPTKSTSSLGFGKQPAAAPRLSAAEKGTSSPKKASPKAASAPRVAAPGSATTIVDTPQPSRSQKIQKQVRAGISPALVPKIAEKPFDQKRVDELSLIMQDSLTSADVVKAKRALAELQSMKAATADHYNMLMLLHNKLDQPDEFDRVLVEMHRAGVAPDVNTLRQQMATAMTKGKAHEARALLNQMKGLPLDPRVPEEQQVGPGKYPHLTVLDYNCVMEAIAHDTHPDRETEAYALIKEMEEAGISPDTMTYTAMIKLYATDGDIEGAEKAFTKFTGEGGHSAISDSYGALLLAYATKTQETLQRGENDKAPDLTRVKQILDEAIDLRLESADLFNIVLDVFNMHGKIKEAREIATAMEELGYKATSETHAAFLFGHTISGDMNGALAYARNMARDGAKIDQEDIALLLQGAMAAANEEIIESILTFAEEQKVEITDDMFQGMNPDSMFPEEMLKGALGGEGEDGEEGDEIEDPYTSSDDEEVSDSESDDGEDEGEEEEEEDPNVIESTTVSSRRK